MAQSKNQIDKLGERLKKIPLTDTDLIALDEYRKSFGSAYAIVEKTLRDNLGLEPAGRPEKTILSIVDKLLRESCRLTQIQDIAGCRVIVKNTEQDQIVGKICDIFKSHRIHDRRLKPSYGYRAVHIVIQIEGRLVEVQVRSKLQHLWAEISERLADLFPGIKYGKGEEKALDLLAQISQDVATVEKLQLRLELSKNKFKSLGNISDKSPAWKSYLALKKDLDEMAEDQEIAEMSLERSMEKIIIKINEKKGK